MNIGAPRAMRMFMALTVVLESAALQEFGMNGSGKVVPASGGGSIAA